MTSRSQWDITENWVREVVKADPRYLVSGYDRRRYSLYPRGNRLESSYAGEMARLVRGPKGRPVLWLLNGDRMTTGGWGNPATAEVQHALRTLTRKTGIRTLTVPYSALAAAGIDLDTVRLIEELDEWWEDIPHESASLDDVPDYLRRKWIYGSGQVPAGYTLVPDSDYADISPDADGIYHWTTQEHHLGASVFRASYRYEERQEPAFPRQYRTVAGTAVFVTGFDANELGERTTPSGRVQYGRLLWFMAQLPPGSRPRTVAEAMEMLKPEMVKRAEAMGTEVLRQGDVFAVRSPLTTAELRAMGLADVQPARNGGRYLNDSHTATRLMVTPDGQYYARGVLRHRPGGTEPYRWGRRARRPEHRNLPLGDGKAWYAIAFNTVPRSRSFSPRAWALGGNVD